MSLDGKYALFVGDKWFRASANMNKDNSIEDTESNPANKSETVSVNSDAENGIDFKQCNSALCNQDDNNRSDTEGCDAEAQQVPLTFAGFCRLLTSQALRETQTVSDEALPYKVAAFMAFELS